MKKTLEAVVKLANDSHFLTSSFPDPENAEKCRHSLALIADLTNRIISEEENTSAAYLKTLKLYFTKYMKSADTVVPSFLCNTRSIKQIIRHLNDTDIYDYPICKTDDLAELSKMFSLFEYVGAIKGADKDFSVCILKHFYSFYADCSHSFFITMNEFLVRHYSEKYYLVQQDFVSVFFQHDRGEDNYPDFLRNQQINVNFISTKFFQDMWSAWCLSRKASTYSKPFLNKNKDRINSEKRDVRKCILAVITCRINTLSSRDELITTQLLPMFGSVNPADISFWNVSSQELRSTYSEYLIQAPKIYYKYFTKTFLEAFFYVLSNGDSSYEQERSLFWLKYIDDIEDIKIGVTTYKDRILRKRLLQLPGDSQMYMSFYNNCMIRINRDNDPAALLMKLKNVLAIEFTDNGNAAYLYRKDNGIAQNLFERHYVTDVSEFKNQTSMYGFIDRIIHRGYWQGSADWTLRNS